MNVHSIHDATAAKRDEAADREKFHPDEYVGQCPIKINKLGHLVYEVRRHRDVR